MTDISATRTKNSREPPPSPTALLLALAPQIGEAILTIDEISAQVFSFQAKVLSISIYALLVLLLTEAYAISDHIESNMRAMKIGRLMFYPSFISYACPPTFQNFTSP